LGEVEKIPCTFEGFRFSVKKVGRELEDRSPSSPISKRRPKGAVRVVTGRQP